jgi:hypothetical protein
MLCYVEWEVIIDVLNDYSASSSVLSSFRRFILLVWQVKTLGFFEMSITIYHYVI